MYSLITSRIVKVSTVVCLLHGFCFVSGCYSRLPLLSFSDEELCLSGIIYFSLISFFKIATLGWTFAYHLSFRILDVLPPSQNNLSCDFLP